MNSKRHYYPLAAMFLACLVLTSCIKKKDSTFDSDSANSHATTDNFLKDISKVISDAAADGNISGKTEGLSGNTCASVTLNPPDLVTFPKTVTVNFGALGCTDQYGVYRQGTVTAIYTDYLHNPGAHVHVTFQDYKVNLNKVEGVYDLANTSPNTTSRTFKDTITNGKITRSSDNKTCEWNATRYSTQTAGFGTLILSDDEYTGGGQSSGTGFNGKSFEAVSTNVLWKLVCKYLVSGTVVIHSNNDPKPLTVDFGNGTCDNTYNAAYDIYNVDLTFWY